MQAWRMRIGRLIIVPLATCIVVSAAAQQAGPRPLRISADDRFRPLVEYLGTQLPDQRFVTRLVPIGELIQAAQRRDIDMVIAAPTHFVALEFSVGATAIATLRESAGAGMFTDLIGGAVICRAGEASIRHLRDLRGKRLAAVDPLALGGWLSAGRELREEGIDPDRGLRVLFQLQAGAVVEAVRKGAADAGVVATGALESMLEAGEIRPGEFRVLPPREDRPEAVGFPFAHSTRLYPQAAFAVLPHVPEALARRIAIALLRMPEDGEVARRTRSAGWSLPIGYESVRRAMQEMRAGPYRDFGKVTLGGALREHWPAVLLVLAGMVGVLGAFAARVLFLNRQLTDSRAALRQELQGHQETQRKRLESEARFRHIFDHSAVGICLTDPGGSILEANGAFRAMLGYIPTAAALPEGGYEAPPSQMAGFSQLPSATV